MRKSAKKLVASFLAVLMIIAAIPFTATATEYKYGETIKREDLAKYSDISPEVEIVWTEYTGKDAAFFNNGDPFWDEQLEAGNVISDYSAVSVEGKTADQLSDECMDKSGNHYVAATLILKNTGGQFGNIQLRFGWNNDEITAGARRSATAWASTGQYILPLEEVVVDPDTYEPIFTDDFSVFRDGNDEMVASDGKQYNYGLTLSYGTTLTEDRKSKDAIYVGDTTTFTDYGYTIEGMYLCTIGFKLHDGVTVSDQLLHWVMTANLTSYYSIYVLNEGGFDSVFSPDGYTNGYEVSAGLQDELIPAAGILTIDGQNDKEDPGSHEHNYGTPVADYESGQAFEEGKSYTHTATCTGEGDCDTPTKTDSCTFDDGEVIQDADYGKPEITKYTCTVCGGTYTKETAPALSHEHNYGTPVADYESDQAFVEEKAYTHTATCTAEGECNAPTKTDSCTFNDGEVIQEADYNQPEITKYTCTVCGGTYTKETAPALSHEHKYGEPVADYTSDLAYNEETAYTHTATCTAEGECDAKTVTNDCTFDAGQVIQEATVDQPEITKYTCSVCGGTYTKETASALKGYDVTVKGSDMGTVTLNDVAVDGDSLTKKIAANGTVKLVATASDTCDFVGWQVGNKIVSTDATYETIVNAPITYTPVFVDKSEALEFVFLDMFGNVISSQRVSNASEVVIPDAPVYNGYKFTGWTADADTIHQSQESMTITALFEKDTDANFTVNAEGATISYGDVSAENTLADIPYGTQVTVTKEGATGWQINGADVAYGDSYTFYVASDVTVAPIDTAVTAKPVVAAVSYSQLSNSHKVEFVASRAMTDDCTLIKAGWVYGKNLTDADLTLDKVGQVGTGTDSGVVKAAYVSSTEGNTQFILSYGITAQTGTASAKAFITYRDAEGEIQTVYSDAMNYTYGA